MLAQEEKKRTEKRILQAAPQVHPGGSIDRTTLTLSGCSPRVVGSFARSLVPSMLAGRLDFGAEAEPARLCNSERVTARLSKNPPFAAATVDIWIGRIAECSIGECFRRKLSAIMRFVVGNNVIAPCLMSTDIGCWFEYSEEMLNTCLILWLSSYSCTTKVTRLFKGKFCTFLLQKKKVYTCIVTLMK